MLRTLTLHDGTQRQVHLGGWRRQKIDLRDAQYAIKLHPAQMGLVLPAKFDKRPSCSPIRDQGDLGSCTSFMRSALVEYNEHAAAAKLEAAAAGVVISNVVVSSAGVISFQTSVTPSAPTPAPTPTPTPTPTPAPATKLVQDSCLFGYYTTRLIEGTTSQDAGGTIRDAVKGGAAYGCVDETMYPYNVSKFAQNPPSLIYTTAKKHLVTSYHAITDGDLTTMKTAMYSNDLLVGFGFTVFDYMMSQQCAADGMLPYPKPNETIQGGHAVVLVGWDDDIQMSDGTKGAVIVRNSWGTGWGQKGYFYMSYKYLVDTNLCNDFWVVSSNALTS